ncbi:MAG TPA: hypothetical protein PKH65_07340 [Bacteroidia bacterium]|nr:hypothetical protein [Bacteroidia bacterium]HNT80482.1 hypothetical protein [Bacteroidia bacterium]
MKNRSLIFLTVLAISISSCMTMDKAYRQGNYDRAISIAAKKLKKNQENSDAARIIEGAYRTAHMQDLDKIKLLQLEGNPSRHTEVFKLYTSIRNRQTLVKTLPEIYIMDEGGRKVEFEFIDVDRDMVNAKKAAADYSYARGEELLQRGGKDNARKAYNEFVNVKKLYSDYKDIDEKISEATRAGSSYVLIKPRNKTNMPLPDFFEKEIMQYNTSELNKQWVVYLTKEDPEAQYDYYVYLSLHEINVSPESVKENAYVESKTIEDGFQYILDGNGNVMKDSLGNDIKVPKYKTISCNVKESHQFKALSLKGSVDFVDAYNGQTLKTEPIIAENFFNHYFATANGDFNALKPETLEKTKSSPLPFPHDVDMIKAATNIYRDLSRKAVYDNRRVIN